MNFLRQFELTELYERYRKCIRDLDQEGALGLLLPLFGEKHLTMPHPVLDDVTGQCVDSIKMGLSNILFFADRAGKNRWAIVQITSFINAVVVGENCYIFMSSPINIIEGLFKNKNKHHWSFLNGDDFIQKEFGGFLVDQKRPYHFFYDALVNSIEYSKEVDAALFYGGKEGGFIEVSKFFGKKYGGLAKEDACYAYPAVINGMRVFGKNKKYMKQVEEMEEGVACLDSPEHIESKALIEKIEEEYDKGSVVFWFGVSNGKRKWHQQVETCIALVNALLKENSTVTVLIDGFTASFGSFLPDNSDIEVFENIKNGLSESVAASVYSLIGHDYSTKIRACKKSEFFVSYAGTGAFVPLRVCKIPGVVHRNEALFSFPDSYSSRVHIVQGEDSPAVSGKQKGPRFIDYNIPCQHVMQALLALRADGYVTCKVGGEVALKEIFERHGLSSDPSVLIDELSDFFSYYSPSVSDALNVQKNFLKKIEVISD